MRRVLACSLVLLLAPVIAMSCGGNAASLCNDICDCEGCSDHDLEECQEAADELEEDVANEDCSSELSAVVSCIQENADCDNDDDYEVDADDCEDEFDDLLDCCDNDCNLEDFF